jgi:hypothetical protein
MGVAHFIGPPRFVSDAVIGLVQARTQNVLLHELVSVLAALERWSNGWLSEGESRALHTN